MMTLGEIANIIQAELIGNPDSKITSIASLEVAKKQQLAYAKKYSATLTHSKAGAVILHKDLLNECHSSALVVDDPYLAFAQISHYFKPKRSHNHGIHPNANTNNAIIAPSCVIGENVVIGKNCTIGAFVIIEDYVIIGENTHIHAYVHILQGCSIGDNGVISSGVVIGSEGFGNVQDAQNHWQSIAHLGHVTIGNNVTIGANTTIDRGTLNNTQINDGVRIDNLVHIAHNVCIGQDTAIAAKTGIAGSTTLGKRCQIGGMVGIVGHLELCDDVIISAKSTVDKNIKTSGIYTGIMPLMPHKQWQNVGLWLVKLDKIVQYLNIKLKNLKS